MVEQPPVHPRAASAGDRQVVVVIGASWGGLNALRSVLTGLPPGFEGCVCVVQHRSSEGGVEDYAKLVRGAAAVSVSEAADKSPLRAGHVYVAPCDYHLLVERGHVALSVDDPVRWARPSVDVLFESAGDSYGPAVIGVVLTGANDDGAAGSAAIRRAGGYVIAQDPEQAERREMPAAAIATGQVNEVLQLDRIGPRLGTLATERRLGVRP